jgi:hypothetical protein
MFFKIDTLSTAIATLNVLWGIRWKKQTKVKIIH